MSIHARSVAPIAFAVLALSGCHKPVSVLAVNPPTPAGIDWSAVPAYPVSLSDFEFNPSKPTFRQGQPVRLVLSNSGSGRHDFSAPAFFATVALRPGGAAPAKGDVSLAAGEKTEIDLVPGAAGQYELECTEFLHSMLGMSGMITVTAASQ